MFGEKQSSLICQKILQRCQGDAAEVMITARDSALTRFANNTIHQNVSEVDVTLMLRYMIGKKMGTAETNRLDDAALDELVAQGRLSARVSAEDTAYPGLPEPGSYAAVNAYDEATAACTAEKRAKPVGVLCRLATGKNLNASGAFTTGVTEIALANSNGLFAYYVSTSADFQTVVMSGNSSGWAHASSWQVDELDGEALGNEAVFKAEHGRDPRNLEPGEYVVVLDPYVTEDLLQMLNFTGMGAQSVLEGRSWMNERIGLQAMHPMVSIWDDALDPAGAPMPFDFEGLPKQRVDLVKAGVVLGPVYDRYTGAKVGKPSTGHALPPTMRGFGPMATHLFMAPGLSSVDEMIASTQRGLYITRFWYTRPVHPRDCVITGMTRDGVFLIENGELAYPVKNLRFTQSYLDALTHVEMVGKDTRLLIGDFGGFGTCVPALKLGKFTFTGTTV